ncbi:hypothetical protein [Paenibacillus sp. y28]|uniref:hypothetical protein n=1 Tax=Paenibacillus sp. y28 TaxID=3129110 RepID=UPI0030192A1C
MNSMSNLKRQSRLIITIHCMLIALLVLLAVWPGTMRVHADKEAVFINDQVYFTLENAILSTNDNKQSFRFTVRLNNDGASTVNYNQYGVKVTTADGSSFSAQLSERVSSLVYSGQATDYKYFADIPNGLSLDQLQVTVFQWDYNLPTFMKSIGSLSAGGATTAAQAGKSQAVLNLNKIDSTLAESAYVTIEPVRSYMVFSGTQWYLYTDISATNLSSTTATLPSGYQYVIKDSRGLSYSTTAVSGQDQALLPNQPKTITLKTAVSKNFSVDSFKLEMQLTSDTTNVLGTLDLSGTASLTAPGDTAAYAADPSNGLEIKVNDTTTKPTTDGQYVQAMVMIKNSKTEGVRLPSLNALYLVDGVVVSADDDDTHPSYLGAGENETYRLSATLPSGTDLSKVQLTLTEAKAAVSSSSTSGVEVPVFAGHLYQAASEPVSIDSLPLYSLNTPLSLKSYSMETYQDLEMKLAEFSLGENDDFGYGTYIAKFVLKDTDKEALALPGMEIELVNADGVVYYGTKQTSTLTTLTPNLGYLLSYSFAVPTTETSGKLALRVKDEKSQLVLAEVQLPPVQAPNFTDTISIYPFDIKIQDHDLSFTYSSTYTYNLELTTLIERAENVVVDSNFSTIRFEMVDSLGRVLGSQDIALTGTSKLLTGKQTISLSNIKLSQAETNLTLKMYEVIETPSGEAKRYIGSFKEQ